ncbi:Hpt domain-containing protein [Marinilabiliaceae bacterium ANBcel2]|nr:Hpt domain-containing protein [Marinilabiliaceae bacterium ANBcel2]
MLDEIKKQFYTETIKELESISRELSDNSYSPKVPHLSEKIFSVSHHISGTGPMLGFETTSKISKKLEKTFYDIKGGQRELTPQIVNQTKRTIDLLIESFNKENKLD